MMKKYMLFLTTLLCFCLSSQAEGLDDLTLVDEVAQISSAEDLKNFALAVNSGSTDLDAVLTADVNYEDFVKIGDTSNNKYAGTFDGKYHTITINCSTVSASFGLFGGVSGTIKNLRVEGSINTTANKVGGIVGECFGGTIENCYSGVNIYCEKTLDACFGGILARSSASGVRVNNCVYAGTVEAPTAYNIAGIVGYAGDGCNATVTNCIFVGTINADGARAHDNPSYTIARRPAVISVSNCFYVQAWGNLNDNTTQVTEEDVASGALCYMLNGNQTEITWWQTLGEDATPVPFDNSKQVYAAGNLNCDGQSADGSELTYSNTKTQEIPGHEYTDGICVNCGAVDPSMATLVDGFYQLENADQFVWFANMVNQGKNTANAKLMDDIDLSAVEFTVIGNSGNHYKGVFDGNYKTLTVALEATSSSWGLFRHLDGTIQNLHLSGTLSTAFNKVAPLVGEIFNGKILNCICDVEVVSSFGGDGAVAGFVGRGSSDGSTLENCIFSGSISGTGYNSAAFIGWSGSKSNLTNCAYIGTIDIDTSQGNAFTFARNNGAVTCTNCYFLNEFGSHQTNTIQIQEEDIVNGKLCYLLNGDQSMIAWTQTIDEDESPIPFPTSENVYNVGDVYGNAYDAESYKSFAGEVIANEEEYTENVIAQKGLVDTYVTELAKLAKCQNIDELVATWKEILPVRNSVASCADAYAAYQQKVDETKKYLEEHDDFSGSKRDQLEEYLTENVEPNSVFLRGSAEYILEARLLSEEEIKAETKKIDAMLEAAITEEPAAGTDMTLMVVNPTFKDGFNGWEGKLGTGHLGVEGSEMHAAECYNSTMDMTQTIENLANGIYEVQINGHFRPYPGAEDLNNTNYAAVLTANGMTNYFQAPIEDMLPAAEAVDGLNCNITGDVPDYVIYDENGEIAGYLPHGMIGSVRAFDAGRYQNAILANVTDGKLTIGIRVMGTGFENDCLGFGNVKLIYHGTLDQAGAGLDNVLKSQAARAYTMVNDYESSDGTDFEVYPNFSDEIKQKLQAAIEAVGTTSGNEGKLALVNQFSDLFNETYTCKKGYINLMHEFDELNVIMDELGVLFTDEQIAEINPLMDQLLEYYSGKASTEEAGKDHLQSLSFMPKKVDGVYHLGTAVELMLFGKLVNAGDNSANAVLTADIDASEAEMSMISSVDKKYAGVFDGQNHTITYTMNTDQSQVALFRAVTGTIKNLRTAGTITTSQNKAAGIVGEIYGGTVQNCVSSVNIVSSFAGDACYGGIAFRASANGCVIKDCLYDGTMDAPNSYNVAGILGFTGTDCASVVSNCLFAGNIVAGDQGSENPSYTISRNPNKSEVENCYYMNGFGSPNVGSSEITEEQLKSGEVAFLLNGDQKSIQWTQKIGEDSAPVPYQTRGTVYANGTLKCDGVTPKDGTTLTYSNTEGSVVDDHNYEDGFCTVCNAADPSMAEIVDGYLQIGTAKQLVWFARKVNSGDTKDNAAITANIDLTEMIEDFPMIGTTGKRYEGTLDGQGHTITINKENTTEGYALIRALAGTVQNLKVNGTINTSGKKVAGIVCDIYGGTVQNCESAVDIVSTYAGDACIGGIVARGSANNSVINNCLFSGSIKSETSWNCAPIVGWCGNVTYITNTLFIGEVEVIFTSGNPYSIARNPGNAKCTNCYYLNLIGTANDGTTQITEEQLKNGEVCALLNAGQETSQWFQTETNPVPFKAAEGGNDDDAIHGVTAVTTSPAGIYNMMGQKVQQVRQGGIYIVNGKKVKF